MSERGSGKKLSASVQVFEILQSQISSGVWKPGERLPSESDLAEQYGVNRLTVRVALQRLNALGVIETRSGSGTRVLEFDLENYLRTASMFCNVNELSGSVAEFRNHIEIECARLACERADDADMAELERLATQHRMVWMHSDSMEHELWQRQLADADIAFHEQVVHMAHNKLYAYAFAVARGPIYEYILSSVRKWTPEMVASFRLDRRRDIHYSIFESIKSRDFTACQSNYAAMISSYTRAEWAQPVVG